MLKPGTKLGPYEIVAQIGAGGMGEVYKGRDTRLDRLVAIKILPAHLADLPELRERFEREAHALANLKHANICVLYDIGRQELGAEDQSRERERPGRPEHSFPEDAQEAEVQVPRFARDDSENSLGGGTKETGRRSSTSHYPLITIHFLVMEYLEGETLSERLKKGPLPVEQVLQYATEIADALDQAHRDGFTHRDIKPGNIMLVPQSGAGPKTTSKVLDFGLAKLKQEVVKATVPTSQMPTVPGGLTQHGTLLGTLQYMSPEQIEGKVDEIDGRTDVFAFGAVVYEMGTGKKAFPGETQASIIAKVLEVDPPPMSSLQPPGKMVPPALDRVVKRCLAKNREDRWQTMRDLSHELTWIKDGGAEAAAEVAVVPRPRLRERVLAAAAAVLLLTTAVVSILHFRETPPDERPARFFVLPPENASFTTPPSVLAISPDGTRLAFTGTSVSGANTQLWVRPLDSLSAQPLPGTEGAAQPFWSPDSRFIAFYSQGKLKKIDVTGGPPQVLCDAPGLGVHGSWNQEGVILFTTQAAALAGRPASPINRVSAAGGTPTAITTVDATQGETGHNWPHFLPDGNHFLYLALNSDTAKSAIRVGSLDSTDSTFLLNAHSFAQYAPPGYLLFQRDGTLMAQPFDADALELTGDAFPIAERVQVNTNGRTAFSVSENGVLAYRSAGGLNTQLAWFDRSGKELGRIGELGGTISPKLSPDGKQVAVYRTTGFGVPGDIWVFDLLRSTQTRLTFEAADDSIPIWSPDGSRIAFASNRNNSFGLYQKNSNGIGAEELLLTTVAPVVPEDWSLDGRYIGYVITEKDRDVFVLPLTGDPQQTGPDARKPVPFLNTQFFERHAQFSPDGRWMAYVSNESGRNEVYVQSFPAGGGKWQVSTAGGVQPRWRRDGRELFYLAPDGKLMAVPIRAGATFEAGTPAPLFQTQIFGLPTAFAYSQQYDVTPDGQRFLLNLDLSEAASAPITVVLNWTAGLRK